MNPTYYRTELLRIFRDIPGLFFTAVLPAFLYVIFGASQSYSDASAGNGNVAAWVMINMSLYGAVTATTGIGGSSAVERMQGWGRQLGLTPMNDGAYVAAKAAVGVTIAAIPVGLIYLLGLITGAEADGQVWVLSAVLVLVGASMFSVFGLSFGLAFKSEGAVSAASGSLVILAFLGNLFFPLSGTMLTVASFTPLYGIAALARYPLTEGWIVNADAIEPVQQALWIPLANVGVWALILGLVATLLVRLSRGRQ
ncbi:MAG: ABC transporter permease [Beutenbergiaceae bacterium]